MSLRARNQRFPWALGTRLFPVLLALLAIGLPSLYTVEVHAESDQILTVQVQQIEVDTNFGDVPAEHAGTRCMLNFFCHAPGLLSASTGAMMDTASTDVARPETMFLDNGRAPTVPTPPPLTARV